MLWSGFILVILGSLSCFNHVSEARHLKHPSSVVVGTVYCDTCFQNDFSRASHFISGATVAVECREDMNPKPTFRQEAQTDKQGEFKVHLPTSISKHASKIEGCRVELIRSSEPYCAVASTATSSPLQLKTKDPKTHVFSAGFFTFKPLKQPDLCSQKPTITNSKVRNIDSMKTLGAEGLPVNPGAIIPNLPAPTDLPPVAIPGGVGTLIPNLPGLPQLPPLPSLPTLPGLPGLPGIPQDTTKKVVEKNPEVSKFLFPPLLPPVLPTPPPGINIPYPPNPLQPAPLLPPVPVPIPGLTPPTLPPPAGGLVPGLPVPPVPGLPGGLPVPPVGGLPGLPLPPVPGLPLPPATTSTSAKKTSTAP